MLPAVVLLVDRLAQMGVQAYAGLAGQFGGRPEQIGGDRERRAGGESDAQHRVERRIVVVRDGLLRGGQDRVDVLDDLVRRQAAPALTEIHRAAGGGEPQPNRPRRLDLGAEQVTAVPGEHVVVVGGGRAALEGEPRQRPGRRGPGEVLVEPGPDRIQRGQPLEQGAVDGVPPGHPLVEVVMGVDQSRGDQTPRGVDALDRCLTPGPEPDPPDGGDPGAVDDHVTLGVLRPVAVDRHHVAVLDDQLVRHGVT